MPRRPLLWSILVSCGTVGCSPVVLPPPPPTPVPTKPMPAPFVVTGGMGGGMPPGAMGMPGGGAFGGTMVTPAPLTADQLASILNINAWSFDYQGRIRCWIEVEETGQKTMASRIPAEGYVATTNTADGTRRKVLFHWLKDPGQMGGKMSLHVENGGGYTLGLPADAFVFGWKQWGFSSNTPGVGQPIALDPAKEAILFHFDATEVLPPGSEGAPRRVQLWVKALPVDETEAIPPESGETTKAEEAGSAGPP